MLYVAVFAALLYLAWIIGYFINPYVATHGIASELTVQGQPHANIFLITDIINLLLLSFLSVMMLRANKSFYVKIVALFYLLFGVATMLSTRFCLLCAPSVQQCVLSGDVLHRTILHYSLGIIAGFALFIAAFTVARLLDVETRKLFRRALLITLTFGILSILLSLTPLNSVFTAAFQRVYLLMLAVYIFVVPFIVFKHKSID